MDVSPRGPNLYHGVPLGKIEMHDDASGWPGTPEQGDPAVPRAGPPARREDTSLFLSATGGSGSSDEKMGESRRHLEKKVPSLILPLGLLARVVELFINNARADLSTMTYISQNKRGTLGD
jgi:hypothetical protein